MYEIYLCNGRMYCVNENKNTFNGVIEIAFYNNILLDDFNKLCNSKHLYIITDKYLKKLKGSDE